jgi:hypothetical protein
MGYAFMNLVALTRQSSPRRKPNVRTCQLPMKVFGKQSYPDKPAQLVPEELIE